MCNTLGEIMTKTENFILISKRKGHNSAKNHQTMTNNKHDLHNPLTYPYAKFELHVQYHLGDNERKLKISYYFQRERGITLSKMIV
jgi:hypothetical protein